MYYSTKRTAAPTLRFLIAVLIGFVVTVCFAQLAVPKVTIEIISINGDDHIKLSWERLEGAEAYNIYYSIDPYSINWGDPAAIVGDTVFTYITPESVDELGTAYYFYVTAIYEVPPGMVIVQGGTFSPTVNYTVTLSSFYISKYEVTQSEWTSVMGGISDPDWSDYGRGPNHPAYRVTWFGAIEYCNRLSIREGLTPAYSYGQAGTNPDDWPVGWNTVDDNHPNVSCNREANGYRLPTEMEWMFAARGGVTAQNAGTFNDRWAGTDVEAELVNYAWYYANSTNRIHPVGTKLPNELGLYDMSGSVNNFVWDIFAVYPIDVQNNPTGPATGLYRLSRGGNWYSNLNLCSVYYRHRTYPTFLHYIYGFRVCRNTP